MRQMQQTHTRNALGNLGRQTAARAAARGRTDETVTAGWAIVDQESGAIHAIGPTGEECLADYQRDIGTRFDPEARETLALVRATAALLVAVNDLGGAPGAIEWELFWPSGAGRDQRYVDLTKEVPR